MAGFENRHLVGGDLSNPSAMSRLSKTLKNLSRLGMKFDDEVLKNSMAVGTTEKSKLGLKSNFKGSSSLSDDDMWDVFASITLSDATLNDRIAFFDKAYSQKREELRNFAINDEIEDALDILTDETIVYDANKFACSVSYNGEIKESLKEELNSVFKQIYNYFNFADGHRLWDYFKQWLIDGFLAFEIIYSTDRKHIIGFKELDPLDLKPSMVKDIDGTYKKIYIQIPKDGSGERVLLDSQIIYVSYGQASTRTRVSYVEKLIRSFNLLRIMEHTRIIWAVVNASYKTKFIIPVGGQSKNRARQSLNQLKHNYREDISFNTDSGELTVNGTPSLPLNKQIWIPEKDGNSPQIENMGGDGPELSDTEAVKYFVNKFRDATKIPYNRFDAESPTGYELAAEGMMRDEIRFAKFISRLRSKFKEILFKPVYNQMILNHPELLNDENFKLNMSINFNKENVFEEMKEYELMQRRIDIISTLKDSLAEQDAEMNEIPFFDLRFLIEKVLIERNLKLSDEELAQNEKYKEVSKLVKEGYGREDAIKISQGASKSKFKKIASAEDDGMGDMGDETDLGDGEDLGDETDLGDGTADLGDGLGDLTDPSKV